MKKSSIVFVFLLINSIPHNSFSKDKVRYQSQGTVDFEKLLIQGELKRPEISAVTGADRIDSLIRMRTQFTDRMEAELGEEAK